jgi:hypothetical protein
MDTLKILPTLKNSPKAVATTKRGNIPFNCAILASILLATVTIGWQNQYNLLHSTVPELPRTLLADLENIKHVMMECDNKKARLKERATTARPEKGKPKRGASDRLV